MSLDRTEVIVIMSAVLLIGLVLWYFFAGKDN